MTLLDVIRGWQEKAKSIAPPRATELVPARGGLLGTAFFPEGFGFQKVSDEASWPRVMAIGHNFGCEDYRNEIENAGREDDKPTWQNLSRLLADAGIPIECCYMTNWYIGLKWGNKQLGKVLSCPDYRYERGCEELLLEQIRTLKPEIILLLGLPVVSRAHRVIPALSPWAGAKKWSTVDLSSLGPIAYRIGIPGTEVETNVVALLHPSFSPLNQRCRRAKFPVEKPEAEMIRSAKGGTTRFHGTRWPPL